MLTMAAPEEVILILAIMAKLRYEDGTDGPPASLPPSQRPRGSVKPDRYVRSNELAQPSLWYMSTYGRSHVRCKLKCSGIIHKAELDAINT